MDTLDKSNLIDALARFLANEKRRPNIEWAQEWARLKRASGLPHGMLEDELRLELREAFDLPKSSLQPSLAPLVLVQKAVILQRPGRPLGKGVWLYQLVCGHEVESKPGVERKMWVHCMQCLREAVAEHMKTVKFEPKRTIFEQLAEQEIQERIKNGTLDYEI